jgi:7,8-dihydropterin-6-yl-methyl-4-(beta-D-ribofuranosyl)aminobenzene 5'-phosphate synthase
MMGVIENMGSVGTAAVTVLVDNKADLIVRSTERVKYFTDEPLLAEHGYSVLIQLEDSEERILWDAGVSRVALMENVRRMKVDVAAIKRIALSHGHSDHYMAMTDMLAAMDLVPQGKEWAAGSAGPSEVEAWLGESRVPLVAHPAAFRERWWQKDDGNLLGPFQPPPEQEWQAMGAELVLTEEPARLGPGCWTTGYIPRKSFEQSGRPKEMRYREGAAFLPDDVEDDQAIVLNVQGKGLVVLSGCAHSGIVNTIEHARRISGEDRVHAVMGGFHLARAPEEEIEQTVDYLLGLELDMVVPSHCTGLKAISRIARAMPEQFVEGVVGAAYRF